MLLLNYNFKALRSRCTTRRPWRTPKGIPHVELRRFDVNRLRTRRVVLVLTEWDEFVDLDP